MPESIVREVTWPLAVKAISSEPWRPSILCRSNITPESCSGVSKLGFKSALTGPLNNTFAPCFASAAAA